MSLRRTDLRLALPRPPRRAAVLGERPAWRDGLGRAGVTVVDPADAPELVVATTAEAEQAARCGAPAVLLEGRGGARALRRAGYTVQRFIPLPSLDRPDLVLPIAAAPALRYALQVWRPPDRPSKRLRNRLVTGLASAGAFPVVTTEQVLGLREPGPPFPIAAARELGVPGDATWFMAPGQGDPLSRLAFHLFAPAAHEPSWVLKLARIPGVSQSFDRDEQGLRLAAFGGHPRHAPTLVGRFVVDELQASVETAALGEPLTSLIGRNRRVARRTVNAIASWIVELGSETASSPATLAEERDRLNVDVVSRWIEHGAPPDLVGRLPDLRGVLQHNDLGSWNVVTRGGDDFVAVDWESARRHGLPLWDLLYFLVDALSLLEGARSPEERVDAAVRMLRGESAGSPMLFDWIRRAAEATDVPPDAVGTVATLCWLHHGLSHVPRRAAAEAAEPGSAAAFSPIDLLAPRWLRDPALGPTWSAWRP